VPTRGVLASILAAFVAWSTALGAKAPAIDWGHIDPDKVIAGELLVGYRDGVEATAMADLHGVVGATVKRTHPEIAMQSVRLPKGMPIEAAARKYLADPRVRHVEPNWICWPLDTRPDDALYGDLWGMTRIDAPKAWDTYQGNSNFVVAVIDTGVNRNHPDLAANIWVNPGEDLDADGVVTATDRNGVDDDLNGYVDDFYGWDTANEDNDPSDTHGHGSHCSGTIGGVGNNGIGVAGVNWHIKIAALKFLDPSGETEDAIEAVDYCRVNHIQLSNNSWGGGGPSQFLIDAIELAGEEANHLFVAAAGNDGSNNDAIPSYPASYELDNLISVAAIAENGSLAFFSNFGKKSVDLGAPGVDILSTVLGTGYDEYSGTSMACPHVTGASAFLWGLVPDLEWMAIRDAILQGVVPNPALAEKTVTGGELNLANSLRFIRSSITFDQTCYQPDAVITFTVLDFRLDPAVTQTNMDVEIRDESGLVQFATVLTINRVGTSARFRTTLDLSTVLPPPQHGWTVHAHYVDADGNDIVADVGIDGQAPVLSDPVVTYVNSDEAMITWKTDEPADSRVILSTNIPPTGLQGLPEQGVYDLSTVTEVVGGVTNYLHAVLVTDLQSASLYYVALLSSDCGGNTGTLPADLSSADAADYTVRLVTLYRQTVLFDNVEYEQTGWSVTSLNNVVVWEHGVPSYGPGTAYSGSSAWGTVLNDRYPHVQNAWLSSPSIQVALYPRVEFQSWHKLAEDEDVDANGVDFGVVEINEGSGWKNVTAYSEEFLGDFVVGDEPLWRHITVDVPYITNKAVQVRFRMQSTPTLNDAGWYVDDIAISEALPPGINVIGYEVDDAGGGDGDGYAEPGETFYLNLRLFNSFSGLTFSNVAADVETSAAGVSMPDASVHVTYGDMLAGENAFSTTQILVRVDESFAAGQATFFHSATADNGGPWSQPVSVQIALRQTIRGTVRDIMTSAGIADAVVRGRANGYPEITAITGVGGAYDLHGAVPGVHYAVSAAKPGLYSRSEEVDATGPSIAVDFALGRAYASPDPLLFEITNRQEQRSTHALTLDNTGGNVALRYSFEIEYDRAASGWLAVAPVSGIVSSGSVAALEVAVDAAGLLAGSYEATLRLLSNDIDDQPILIPVTLQVEGGPVLSLAGVLLQGGDGDPFPEPGETLDLNLLLRNSGDTFTFGVDGTLQYAGGNGNATVTDPDAMWFFINANSIEPSVFDPSIHVSGVATSGAPLQFVLNVTDDTGWLWSFPFALTTEVRYAISGQVTELGVGTPVPGAVVTARGPVTNRATTAAGGGYAIYGLVNGAYTVSVLPPLPFSQPTSRVATVSGADVGSVNFQVAQWAVSVNPSSVVASVKEGIQTSKVVTVSNNGPVSGHVDFRVELVQGIPSDVIDVSKMPAVDWMALKPGEYLPGRLLVLYRPGTKPDAMAQSVRAVGGEVLHRYRLAPAALLKVPAGPSLQSVAAALAADPAVLRVEPDYLKRPYELPNDVLFEELWALRNHRQTGGTMGADIRAVQAWESGVGRSDVKVAIIDTGIEVGHEDLAANMWTNPDEQPGDGNGDGFPGVEGVDDDGDGGVDFEDVDVARILTNGLDDDGDDTAEDEPGGELDDSPGVVGVDDDFDGVVDDFDGAIFDDDENGYVDDIEGYDFGENDSDPRPDYIAFGADHGTHVAGTVGAVGNNDIGVVGVNWTCGLMATKASIVYFDPFFGTFVAVLPQSATIAALDYSVARGSRVSNHSYGGSFFSGVEYVAMQNAGAAGHLCVCAAGNDGTDNDQYPAYPASYDLGNIISVAASDHDDLRAWFSNYGATTVDLAAPGVDILSTITDFGADGYDLKSGTSMASPQVCGAAALLFSLAPAASGDMVKQAIIESVRFDARLVDLMTAPGHLDVAAAVGKIAPFWLTLSPAGANLAPGASVPVTVTMNAGGRLPAGTYKANIVVQEDRNGLTVPVTLTVQPAAVPKFASVMVSDASPGGDGDGRAEPGETVDLVVTIANEGSAILASPSGTLSTASAGITLPDNRSAWSSMASGESKPASDPFRIALSGAATNPSAFSIQVRAGAAGPWTLGFSLPVQTVYSITGIVRDAQSLAPLPGVPVEYWGAAGGLVTTGSNGTYRIDGLANGTYRVRPLPLSHEKPAPGSAVVSGANRSANFDVRAPDVTFRPEQIDAAVLVEEDQTETLSFSNATPGNFSYKVIEFPPRRVALISDGSQLNGLSNTLSRMGFSVSVLESNVIWVVDEETFDVFRGGRYSGDDALVFQHDLVIADLSGSTGAGRLISAPEAEVFTRYLARGGKLILTSANALSQPDDELKLDLVGASSADRTAQEQAFATAQPGLSLTEFVSILPGESVAVSPQAYDLAAADTNASPQILFKAGSANKILRRLTPEGGVVYLWGGNDFAGDWAEEGAWRDYLKNVLVYELQADQPWLDVSPMTGAVAGGSAHELLVRMDAALLDVGTYRATLLVKGNYPGADTRFVPVTFTVKNPTLDALSSTGVKDWMNQPLPGDGSLGSSVFQLIYAGADGIVDPPTEDGRVTGDDVLLRVFPTGEDFGRVGTGFATTPDLGLFQKVFLHELRSVTPVRKVYVRAWDGQTYLTSVAYGDSPLYDIRVVADETHDFGTWTVDRVLNYPGFGAKDTNGDSIPDGWDIARGLDPRLPIAALEPALDVLQTIGSFGTTNGAMRFPSRAFTSDKHLFVLDTQNNRIEVFDRQTGLFVLKYGATGAGDGQFSQPFGMGRHPTLNTFAVADTANNRVQVFTFDETTGAISFQTRFGSLGTGNGQFNNPYGVAIDPVGRINVVDTRNHRVQIFSGAGAHIVSFGSFGTLQGRFNLPKGIAVDAIGIVYIADTDNNRVQAFNGAGSFLWSLGSEGTEDGQFLKPIGVQPDAYGRLIVADTSNHRIQVFDPAQGHSASLGGIGSNPGQFWFPHDVTPIGGNQAYVVDTWNHRIQLVSMLLDGDGDGMDDTWELDHGLDPADPADAQGDPDGDGVSNLGEYRLGTDPRSADSDGDGVKDGRELLYGTDPGVQASSVLTMTAIAKPIPLIIEWSAVSGKVYVAESAVDARNGSAWTAVPNTVVTANQTGARSLQIAPLPPETNRFYRVREVGP
jgi:subtilisin family serine protease